jgi:hypothetical protein
MKHPTNYLKMRVLGALEYATGHSMEARYQAVAAMTFLDEAGQPRQFTWRRRLCAGAPETNRPARRGLV